ncbi:MAG: glycosyltransferase [Planctomyces sp.]|nr:glycosyltransferase [Planctomyces sp.]
MRLSILIPVYNESESLVELHRELAVVLDAQPFESEILFVDDGSRDASWGTIKALAETDPRVRGIRFRRNFGKAAALSAGMRAARGELIMMLDADLQDDPAGIPRFLETLGDDWDVVNGWKIRRLDPWHKIYPSWVFNAMVSRLTGLTLHDHNCGIKLFRAEVAREIRLYGELHRFIPVLAHMRGFRVTEIDVHHRSRQHGFSKYGFRRFTRGFLDLLTVSFLSFYRQRPQHLLGAAGLFLFAIGATGLTWLAGEWVLMNLFRAWPATPIGGRPLLAYSLALAVLGGQAMSLGFLAELIVHFNSRESDAYSVAERVGMKDQG